MCFVVYWRIMEKGALPQNNTLFPGRPQIFTIFIVKASLNISSALYYIQFAGLISLLCHKKTFVNTGSSLVHEYSCETSHLVLETWCIKPWVCTTRSWSNDVNFKKIWRISIEIPDKIFTIYIFKFTDFRAQNRIIKVRFSLSYRQMN